MWPAVCTALSCQSANLTAFPNLSHLLLRRLLRAVSRVWRCWATNRKNRRIRRLHSNVGRRVWLNRMYVVFTGKNLGWTKTIGCVGIVGTWNGNLQHDLAESPRPRFVGRLNVGPSAVAFWKVYGAPC